MTIMASDNSLTPSNVPRQKTYLYIFLIFCTAILIYLYSYPLEKDWNLTGFLSANNESQREDDIYPNHLNLDASVTATSPSLLTKLVSKLGLSYLPSKSTDAINVLTPLNTAQTQLSVLRNETVVHTETSESITTLKFTSPNPTQAAVITFTHEEHSNTESNRGISKFTHEGHPNTETNRGISEFTHEEHPNVESNRGTKTYTSTQRNIISHNDTSERSFEDNSTEVKGFLVFSSKCRIPDLDPFHPSIRHLIEYSPPLNCSEKHEAITKTSGDMLLLDEAAAQARGGNNFTCCYKSVNRKNDGSSDNSVGFGKCIKFTGKARIEDEFITVNCNSLNGTLFYQEFHSFIHDKPQVEKRCNSLNNSQYSVLIVGVDAVSRLNMHRQLNRTFRYLTEEMESFEMYGFNKVGDNTFPNLIPLFLGLDERELPEVCWSPSEGEPLDKCNFLWKRFAKAGYRTFYAEDAPHISSFNYLKRGFYLQPTDYYFRHFIYAYEEALGRKKPLNCDLCVGSISETEAVLHWAEKFAAHFHNRPYFAFSWINSLTHDFLNMGSSGDHMYELFFRSLHQSGALNKTIVIVMGDHGMRWGEIRKTFIGRLEERLPMLMISLPPEFKRHYPEETKYLRLNTHRLITPFDLHATLLNILHLQQDWTLRSPDDLIPELSNNFTKRALSLFRPIPQDRSCDDAFIEEHWCTCEESLPIDTDIQDVKRAAKFITKEINSLLQNASNKCSKLKLKTISDARLWQPPSEHTGHSAEDTIYTVVIQAKPGGAIFEGTVRVSSSGKNFELLGAISRLNLYGNQSSCVSDAVLRKYCYCL